MFCLTQSVVYEDVLVLGLHQVGPLLPDVGEEGLDVDLSLGSQLFQHGVDDDVGASSAHSSTAVNHHWTIGLLLIKSKTLFSKNYRL